MAATPQNNWIQINMIDKNSNRLAEGQFTITDFIVTAGQATSLAKGQTQRFFTNRSGGFTFLADRKPSIECLNWWKARVHPNQTCWNAVPESLNFAVQGTLTLEGAEEPYPPEGFRLVFQNVFFGQESVGAEVKWWFAVAGHTHLSGKYFPYTIRGRDLSGVYWSRFEQGSPLNTPGAVTVWI